MRLIFWRVSGDSSSDSLDLPPVLRRILGFGDLEELGEARGRGGEALPSVESLCRATGDSAEGVGTGEGRGEAAASAGTGWLTAAGLVCTTAGATAALGATLAGTGGEARRCSGLLLTTSAAAGSVVAGCFGRSTALSGSTGSSSTLNSNTSAALASPGFSCAPRNSFLPPTLAASFSSVAFTFTTGVTGFSSGFSCALAAATVDSATAFLGGEGRGALGTSSASFASVEKRRWLSVEDLGSVSQER